ncbi:M48 family metallopeptidase [Oleiphilus sp. HI0132]|jgi:predicted Zn-dependent protease|nr:M48 family metallopeptidase [Oleiphilus sp. HI0132]
MFSSFSEDVKIGQQQYQPAQQSQGGAYNLDPKLSEYVSTVGMRLAALSDVPKLPYEFVVLNNSVPNAWALPSGKIAINRGLLLKLESEAQLAAVLSHEIVHAAARHGAQRQRDNLLVQVGMAGLGLGLANNDYRDLIIGGANLGARLTTAKYGRDHELESDHYGMKYMAKAGYNLQGAVELQKVFVSLSKQQKSSWLDGLFASHPPSQERVEANIKYAASNPVKDAFSGKEAYQQAIAYLKSKQEAYDLADQANAALAQKDYDLALSLISKASNIEPKEALFSAIKGDALAAKGNKDSALAAHMRATELNPNQFSYYLKRAQSYAALGQSSYAIDDYRYSMRLLPTSIAALQLGELYSESQNQEQALKYYAQAAQAQGDIGQQAKLKLALIEIKQTPEKYLKAKHVQDPKGPLLVTIENHSPLNIGALQLRTQLIDANGKVIKIEEWSINETIPAQKRSPYYPAKVVYHLKTGEKVKTSISSVTLE